MAESVGESNRFYSLIHRSLIICLRKYVSLQPGGTPGIQVMPELGKQAAVWKASPGNSKSSEWRQGGFIAQWMCIRAPQRADIPFDCLSRRVGFLPLRLCSVFPLDAN